MKPDDDILNGEERLDDALMREYARSGTGADEAFLSQLESRLDESAFAMKLQEAALQPAKASHRSAWWMGAAAAVIIASGLTIMHLVKTPRIYTEVPMLVEYQIAPPDKHEIQPRVSPHEPSAPSSSSCKTIISASSIEALPIPELPPIALNGNIHDELGDISFSQGWGSDYSSIPAGMAPQPNHERYSTLRDNRWTSPLQEALSTFSVDVDTASYTNLRRMIQQGVHIPQDAVRLEEMVNYFDYSYTPPTDGHPFAIHVANASCPWNPDHQLVRVALKGREIVRTERAPANLVFLLDVSGSMNEPRKLPLVIRSFKLLIEELNEADTLSIVVYAGAQGLALPPTRCDAAGRKRIEATLGRLSAGGSTNGGAGIQLAYQLAKQQFKPGGINRVILATDGDFNVGVTDNGGLIKLVEENAKSKVFLTVLGFGGGNLNDSMMEAITNKGDGTYHFIDGDQEARRVFLDKLMSTLVTIAKDVKVQVEFNPAHVKRYRLIGYANRMLRKEDFANDKIDAGDIGSGHTVTAFYEIETGNAGLDPAVEPLRYQKEEGERPVMPPVATSNPEWLTVKLRYKQPEGDKSTRLEYPFIGTRRAFNEAEADFRFASSVAMTGLLLRNTEGLGDIHFKNVIPLAAAAIGSDPQGQRAEFLNLIRTLAARDQATSPRR